MTSAPSHYEHEAACYSNPKILVLRYEGQRKVAIRHIKRALNLSEDYEVLVELEQALVYLGEHKKCSQSKSK